MRLAAFAVCALGACTVDPLGPRQPVELVRDELGFTHVYARSDHDAFFGAGYAMARDRLMQMEMYRRQAAGTSAALVGAAGLADDRAARVMNFAALGRADWKRMKADSPDDAMLVEAWIDGVNRRIAELRIGEAPLPPGMGPGEYDFLPAPWQVEETFAIGKRLAFGLSNTLDQDLLASVLLRLAPTLPDKLPPSMPSYDAFVLPSGGVTVDAGGLSPVSLGPASLPGVFARPPSADEKRAALARLAAYRPLVDGGHSNNWAVDGRFTDNGRPYVVGDPHQPTTTPSRFWPMHMSSAGGGGTLDVVGFAFPGTPAVQLGHNARVGWTATTNFADVMDLWDVVVAPDGKSTVVAGKTLTLQTRHEVIKIRRDGAPLGVADDETLDVTEAPGVGVLLPDVLLPVAPSFIADNRIFLGWTGFQPTAELAAYLAIDRAQNLDELERGVDKMEVGAVNFVGADQGGITYRVHALVPDRGDPASHSMPWHILPGGDAASAWGAPLPESKLPHVRNPPRGLIISANNDPFGFTADGNVENDPWYYGAFFANGARAQRIDDALTALLARSGTRISRADMEDLQGDVHSLFADTIVPALSAAQAQIATDPALAAFRGRADIDALAARLAAWDRNMDVDQRAPADFSAVAWFATARILSATVPSSLFGAITTRSPPFLVGQLVNVLDGRAPGAAGILGGDEAFLLVQALDDATRYLATRFPSGQYTYGDLQQLAFDKAWPLAPDPGAYPVGGGLDTVRVSESAFFDADVMPRDFIHPGEVSLYRMVIGFDEDGTPRATLDFLLGASEAPGPFYSNRMSDWLANRHQLLPFKRADVDAHTASRVTLQ